MPAYSGMWTLSQVAQAIKNLDWVGLPPTVVEYLIVAGGGSGGGTYGAGGGAGGLLQGYAGVTPGTSYFVTVGGGGAGAGDAAGNNGDNSVFDSTSSGAFTGRIVATGGGGAGKSSNSPTAGKSGGSGGGAGGFGANRGGTGISGQGNAGGASVSGANYGSGGGGGAGTVGFAGTTTSGGNGGAGIASDITGTRVVYAGGGGGGIYDSGTGGIGGVGGGGSVNPTQNTNGNPGQPNTGGGGSGNIMNGGALTGGNGGSGIVVIRYPGNVQFFTGGTLNYSNGFMVHTFYSSGTLAPTTPRLFASPDYQISRSLRFNSADSAYLNRTPGSASNRKTWTWSGWIKRSKSGDFRTIFSAATDTSNLTIIRFHSDDRIEIRSATSGSTVFQLLTTQVFRDYSAWYHFVVSVDTTNTNGGDRVRFYVNGSEVTTFDTDTNPTQYADSWVNNNILHEIGRQANNASNYYQDGYMTEINFIDGQQLTPASFGYTESSTGVWTPLQYTGTYGTNGFYLNFADNSNTTAATLGKDLSGNGNNFTPNNFSVTAGVGNDSLVDSPTNYGTDTGAGGEVRGNYCTLNPLSKDSGITLSNGNLDYSSATNADDAFATMGLASGKWYFEFTPTSIPTLAQIGVATNQNLVSDGWLSNSVSYRSDGQKYVNGTASAYGATFVANDVIGAAVDIDNNLITFYKNNASQGAISYTFTGLIAFPVFRLGNTGGTGNSNFGQRPFAYTAPSGYRALCTQNLPTSILPQTAFAVNTFTASNSSRVIGTGIQSDLVLTKRRDSTYAILWHDALRGAGRTLYGNDTSAEVNNGSAYIQTFNSDSYGIGGSDNALNGGSGATYVSWTWNAGGTTVTNTTGGISAQVRANPAAGFSIVTYTGTSASSVTIGHGLGAAPNFIILKNRSATSAWYCYHSALGANARISLNLTDAAFNGTGLWNSTAPTSTVFSTVQDGASFNNGSNHIAYCWAEVAGYSRFGSYTGNGAADGPFVYCGFRPRWIMIKSTGTESWGIWDSVRSEYNFADDFLLAQSNAAEQNGPQGVDFLSNGFKVRGNYAINNTNGQAYIFAAYAESPLKYSRGR